METILKSIEDTRKLADRLAEKLPCPAVVAFTGGLGVGKTTFIRFLCHALGYTGTVTSPTFTIMNEYVGRVPIYHYDMYRLSGADALYETGFYDYTDSGISLIEWSENVADGLDTGVIRIDMDYFGEYRKIRISGIDII